MRKIKLNSCSTEPQCTLFITVNLQLIYICILWKFCFCFFWRTKSGWNQLQKIKTANGFKVTLLPACKEWITSPIMMISPTQWWHYCQSIHKVSLLDSLRFETPPLPPCVWHLRSSAQWLAHSPSRPSIITDLLNRSKYMGLGHLCHWSNPKIKDFIISPRNTVLWC